MDKRKEIKAFARNTRNDERTRYVLASYLQRSLVENVRKQIQRINKTI